MMSKLREIDPGRVMDVIWIILAICFFFVAIPYFFIKQEEDRLKECHYVIIDAHSFHYNAISYKKLPGNCISIVNHKHNEVIICGQYTIEKTK
jgi:hypothetical protein